MVDLHEKYTQKTCIKFYTKKNFPLRFHCVYLLKYFCVYFLHECFMPVFSYVICMQRGGLTPKKHVCNAAMPMACSV